MGLKSIDAKIMHAKRRIKAGKAKEGDFELVGENPKKEEPPKFEQPKTNFEHNYKDVSNSETFKKRDLESFVFSANENSNPDAGSEFINDFSRGETPKGSEGSPEPEQNRENSNSFKIKGYMVLMLVDMVAPLLISFIFKKFLKTELESSEIKLSEQQIKDNTEIADQVAEEIGIAYMNPITALALSLSLGYATNAYMAYSIKKGGE